MIWIRRIFFVGLVVLLIDTASSAKAQTLFVEALTITAAQEGAIQILAFGDSLTAGYGLPESEGFVAKLSESIKKMGINVDIVNAGVSGDTSSGGRARLAWTLDRDYDIVLVALGGNDALRGIPPAETRANLDGILRELTNRGARVVLIGMIAPTNWGAEFKAEFDAIYPDLAKKYQTEFYPFFLEGVAGIPQLNQSDGIHPNAEGVRIIVERIVPLLLSVIQDIQKRQS